MTIKPFIVVSGLPGSGKTTLAIRIAANLALPLLDKDDILETLFDSFDSVDLSLRQRLSRASDSVLAKVASRSAGAVIVSFWCHNQAGGTAGTPTGWLKHILSAKIVEVFCDCPLDLAETRFRERQRHPGHNDSLRAPHLRDQLESLAVLGPLGVGELVRVSTGGSYDFDQVMIDIRRHLAN